jgi:hypothetical protein
VHAPGPATAQRCELCDAIQPVDEHVCEVCGNALRRTTIVQLIAEGDAGEAEPAVAGPAAATRAARRPARLRGPLRTAASIGALLLLVGGIIWFASAGREPSESESGTPTPQTDEEILLDVVPSSAGACRSMSDPSSYFSAAIASVRCKISGATSVQYHLFASSALLRSAYRKSLRAFTSPPRGRSCLDPPFSGPWSDDAGGAGRMQCYHNRRGRAFIEWTQSELLIYGMMSRRDGDLGALRRAWRRASP